MSHPGVELVARSVGCKAVKVAAHVWVKLVICQGWWGDGRVSAEQCAMQVCGSMASCSAPTAIECGSARGQPRTRAAWRRQRLQHDVLLRHVGALGRMALFEVHQNVVERLCAPACGMRTRLRALR